MPLVRRPPAVALLAAPVAVPLLAAFELSARIPSCNAPVASVSWHSYLVSVSVSFGLLRVVLLHDPKVFFVFYRSVLSMVWLGKSRVFSFFHGLVCAYFFNCLSFVVRSSYKHVSFYVVCSYDVLLLDVLVFVLGIEFLFILRKM